jgi:hypothetical protein
MSLKVSAAERMGVGRRPIPSSLLPWLFDPSTPLGLGALPLPDSDRFPPRRCHACVLSVYDQRKSTEAELIYTEITDG